VTDRKLSEKRIAVILLAANNRLYLLKTKRLSDIMNCFKISESYYLIIALIVNRGTAQNYCFDPQFSDH
jgi:hypothetical protein